MGKGKADLAVYWSKRERALVYDGNSPTGGWLSGIFERIKMAEMNEDMCGEECKRNGLRARLRIDEQRRTGRPRDPSDFRTLVQELEARGYDPATLRFTIRKKTPTPT